jgi:hypothetical protein
MLTAGEESGECFVCPRWCDFGARRPAGAECREADAGLALAGDPHPVANRAINSTPIKVFN